MSKEWDYVKHNTYYRVTRAGNAIRLYRNNVLHSQWNPKRPVSGKLWDLFLISALGAKRDLSRILVLGAGGGSVINLIHTYFPDAYVDAIDLDKVHLKVAKKFFGLNTSKCQLIHDDAQSWLKKYNGKKYDLIIDDVFTESENIPFRSIQAKCEWMKQLLKNLNKNGVVVFNFADQKEWNKSRRAWKHLIGQFNVAIATHYLCENKIVHISKNDISYKNVMKTLKENHCNNYLKYFNNGTISYQSRKKQ